MPETLASDRALQIIEYHYVRDLPRSRFPKLKAMPADDFRRQVQVLQTEFEMATLESALAFVAGSYVPSRDLCLLTFDDGFRDHFDCVFPCLEERHIQGVFFLITSCLDARVATVHKNHFLLAELGFELYRRRVTERLTSLLGRLPDFDPNLAPATYRWDDKDVGQFKYLLNFVVPDGVRQSMLDEMFTECFGSEPAFAAELYLSWAEARTMQENGMIIGGHTHLHAVLSRLSPTEQWADIGTSTALLRRCLHPQRIWPFSYPYGKSDSFDDRTVHVLREMSYDCAFTTVPGFNNRQSDPFGLRRIDPKEVAVAVAGCTSPDGLGCPSK
jgi:peptidoglycan/xylan/chitin deacetylase (PgdA/CDA1 family)